jgi:hypothetical protein
MTDGTYHAPLAPSSAHRWGPGGCPASPAMEARYPEDTESQEAREGTAAHWVLEQILRGQPEPAVGTLTPNGHPVTVEMIQGVAPLVDDIRDTQRACQTPGYTIRIEEYVSAAETIHPDNGGTPDCYLLDRGARVLHVWDFKFGHRQHDPFRHWQMVDYAACIMDSEGFTFDDILTFSYTFTIGQPRAYHPDGPVREWHAPGTVIGPMLLQLRVAAHAASEPDAQCQTGPHCRDCRAAWDCVANQRVGGAAIDVAYAQQSTGMDAAALGLELRMIDAARDRLKARGEALEARVMGLQRAGQSVPHWTLGSTKPRTVWRDGSESEVALMGDIQGVELRKAEIPLVTPAQAVKLGLDQSVIDAYAYTPKGNPKLEPCDEGSAARVFGNR